MLMSLVAVVSSCGPAKTCRPVYHTRMVPTVVSEDRLSDCRFGASSTVIVLAVPILLSMAVCSNETSSSCTNGTLPVRAPKPMGLIAKSWSQLTRAQQEQTVSSLEFDGTRAPYRHRDQLSNWLTPETNQQRHCLDLCT